MLTSRDLCSAMWRTSSYSNGDGGNCVEVADGFPGLVPVRDSKNPGGPALAFGAAGWARFVDALRSGSL
ncbi:MULTISPECIES: DUF397 domain-containing protein [Streptomyces]|uniref:DUF397 domain-containing protein n=1 Tax=Streptomyces glycanivorans TaxID=3033808 RepID=A0ABY9J6C7_9ACTN|nr:MULTISPECIES: DUF397 domain-containing protein [unclassified Streptomyces]WSQ76844.1 DUF397 domain-containing protein [Streptomyces sp. NBC_01213]TXS18553.1 DUF397 domain-containing protein [Streptomyces sp. wa22]WLQ63333.1 DUF397 domain-containing protein [Streptomyces sp. Alt3]WSQ84177.1 DUF397 domain-containing protein [Streptomyces sp. NBC_01212]WSR09877.1 DUF397 domain-containing protein [Streptomyces sp. NBC_01208]